MANWLQDRFNGGSLGCFNPASVLSGGTPSLHADGRAFDLALNAFDDVQRQSGDAAVFYMIVNHEIMGTQELLWRGYLWSYQRRAEGLRGPGIQQSAHSNHVHIGIDRATADSWTTDRVPQQEEDLDATEKKMLREIHDFVRLSNETDVDGEDRIPLRPWIAQRITTSQARLSAEISQVAAAVVAQLPAGQAVDVNALATAIVAQLPPQKTTGTVQLTS